MVVEILVSHRHAEDPLAQQFGQGVLDELRAAAVGEAGGELIDHARAAVHLAEQEHAAVGAGVAALEIGHHFALAEALKSEGLLVTLCHAAVGFCV